MSFTYTALPDQIEQGLQHLAPDIDVKVRWWWEEDEDEDENEYEVVVIVTALGSAPWVPQGRVVLGGVWATNPDPNIQGYLLDMLREALMECAQKLDDLFEHEERAEFADARDQCFAASNFLDPRTRRREQMLEDVKRGVRKPRGGGGRFQSLELFEDEPVVVPPRPASGRFKRVLENPKKKKKTKVLRCPVCGVVYAVSPGDTWLCPTRGCGWGRGIKHT